MKTFPLDTIWAVHNQHREAGYPEVPLEHKGQQYSYFVIPEDKGPKELPNFVQRLTPDPDIIASSDNHQNNTAFGISSSVQEKFRRFAVAHEIEEFMYIGIDVEGRCKRAAQAEVDLVHDAEELTAAEKMEYFRMRSEFFRVLCLYAEQHPEIFTRKDQDEFYGSYIFFEKTCVENEDT